MAKKKSRSSEKIEIVKIQNKQNLQVTFSKRRAGLYKKASELCSLTGSEIALVVFSPAEKAYTFGSPNANSIVERFKTLTSHLESIDPWNLVAQTRCWANVQHSNKMLTFLENQLEVESKKRENLNHLRKIGQNCNWWEASIDELNVEQVKQSKLAQLVLQKKVNVELQKVMCKNAIKHPILQGIHPSETGHVGVHNTQENIFGVYDIFQTKSTETMAVPPYVGPFGVNASTSIK